MITFQNWFEKYDVIMTYRIWTKKIWNFNDLKEKTNSKKLNEIKISYVTFQKLFEYVFMNTTQVIKETKIIIIIMMKIFIIQVYYVITFQICKADILHIL